MSAPGAKTRLLIDASVVTPVSDGLSVYVINLLKHLPEDAFEQFDISVLFTPGLDRPEFFAALGSRPYRRVEEKLAPIGPRRDWDWLKFLRRRGREFDLVHITSNQYPMALKGGICTIHDVTFKRVFHNPGGIPGARHLAVAYLTRVVRTCLRKAGWIMADSAHTRAELRDLFHATPRQMEKIEVVHLGWEHILDHQDGDPGEGPSPYPGRSYLFYLGAPRPHKNLARLLDAFRLALDDLPADKILVIGGTRHKSMSPDMQAAVAAINARGERVVFTDYLSNAEVGRHYAHADAFVFPSLMEGFGIPVLESFHYGTPLLCADATSLPEVAGDAALFFDPFSTKSIAQALTRFYLEPELRDSLIARGRERLKDFAWKRTAGRVLEVYREQAGLAPAPAAAEPERVGT